MKGDRQLQELGVFVHGILTGLHILGVVYNLRRRNYLDAAAHAGAAAYDAYAVSKHMRSLEGMSDCGHHVAKAA